ncbi:hypothetical protein [Sinorhizobium terangae]|uniref:Uncharacterized protein n=1 Tax=Sinorhizobium terangae TaxID=110322 RepID=A0A6N7LJC1_SINTE|nr:hypothetical protein [Sinorhizobium terangae]MBB4189124.1 hypothetical protein [Sinorhizobium terangae]MQX17973.1 hypothetical protein [Sinorhizobium terangae]WFU46816.1 hypothetical protein QA637_13075 [Sinorhizobium terangae]
MPLDIEAACEQQDGHHSMLLGGTSATDESIERIGFSHISQRYVRPRLLVFATEFLPLILLNIIEPAWPVADQ